MTSNEQFVIDRWKRNLGHRFECAKCLLKIGYGRKALRKMIPMSEHTAQSITNRYRGDAPRRIGMPIGLRTRAKPERIVITAQIEWIIQQYAHNAIMEERAMEQATLQRFEDCDHWWQHPIAKWQRQYISSRNSKDNYFFAKKLRSRIYCVLNGLKKSASTLILLGCSIDQLKAHLQGQFKRGMTWKNYGMYGWHIDHVVPCSAFDLSKPEHQRKCFHYSNLQPMWAEDNWAKSDVIVECQPELLMRI